MAVRGGVLLCNGVVDKEEDVPGRRACGEHAVGRKGVWWGWVGRVGAVVGCWKIETVNASANGGIASWGCGDCEWGGHC